MKKMIKKIKGFTLIELLLVIAILGILVALLLPRFEDVRATANTRVCVGNLRGLANAMAVYETSKNNPNVSWGTTGREVANIVTWQYLATEPGEPYGVTSSTTYTLTSSSGNLPDRAACPVIGATSYDPNSEHHWP